MFEVTELATQNLKSYMEQNKIDSALRVSLMSGGWSGPSLGLALDEPKETDAKYEQDGLTFLVDNNLLDTCGSIKIDFMDAGMRSGFSISSTKPIGGGGCSSSAGCSSSGCGWFFSFYFQTYPRAVFCTGVFFCPLKLNFHYKSHFTQPSSRKTDSEFKIQNSKLSADSFPPFLDRLLERS